MKTTNKTIILAIFILLISTISAQNFTAFSTSLNKGDISEITSQLDNNVEVSILDNDSYTITEAEPLIKKFFSKRVSSTYKPIHKGSTIGNAYYQIGELVANNETFRTYMYSKEVDGQYLIQEFRIEKE